MSDTSGKPVNGKHEGDFMKFTGGAAPPVGPTPIHIDPTPLRSPETIAPEALYRFYSASAEQYESDVPIAVISKAFATAADRLSKALAEDDELQRENHVSLASASVFELAAFAGVYPAFDEGLSILLSALGSHRAAPFQRNELIALLKVYESLKRNPVPDPEKVETIYEALDNAGFDLNAPMTGADISEDESSL